MIPWQSAIVVWLDLLLNARLHRVPHPFTCTPALRMCSCIAWMVTSIPLFCEMTCLFNSLADWRFHRAPHPFSCNNATPQSTRHHGRVNFFLSTAFDRPPIYTHKENLFPSRYLHAGAERVSVHCGGDRLDCSARPDRHSICIVEREDAQHTASLRHVQHGILAV